MSSTWQAKNPEQWNEYKRAYYAANADKIREKKREWVEANRERVNASRRGRYTEWWQENKHRLAESELLRGAKRRAKASGIECSITLADIVIPEVCPLLGIPLRKGDGVTTGNSPSLDRKDNAKGYIPGNVWVISYRANTAKGTLSADELILIGTNLKRTLEEGAEASAARDRSSQRRHCPFTEKRAVLAASAPGAKGEK